MIQQQQPMWIQQNPDMNMMRVIHNLADAYEGRPEGFSFAQRYEPDRTFRRFRGTGAPMIAFQSGNPYARRANMPTHSRTSFPEGLESFFRGALDLIPELRGEDADDAGDIAENLMEHASMKMKPTKDGSFAFEVNVPKESLHELRQHLRERVEAMRESEEDRPPLRVEDPFASMFHLEPPPLDRMLELTIPEGSAPIFDLQELSNGIGPDDGAMGPWKRDPDTNKTFMRLPLPDVDPKKIKIKVHKDRLMIDGASIRSTSTNDGTSMSEEDFHEEFVLPYHVQGKIKASAKGHVLTVTLPTPAEGDKKTESRRAPESTDAKEHEKKESQHSNATAMHFYPSDTLPVRRR